MDPRSDKFPSVLSTVEVWDPGDREKEEKNEWVCKSTEK